mgnify:CR=1 FL=1
MRQARLNNELQAASKIPLLIGMDAEWGLSMRLDSTYAFPWNMTLGAIKDNKLIEQTGVIGEKLEICCFEAITGEQVYAYNHPGNRTAAILAVNVATEVEVVKNIAMQIAAMNPVSIDKADCPQSVIEKEIEIAKDLLRQEGKPEDMIDKIAQGKLTRFFKDSTLLNQDFIKDGKTTVAQYLQSVNKDLTVTAFRRYSLAD